MKREPLDASKYVFLLKAIVARWPKTEDEEAASLRSLGDDLANGFDVVDLSNHIGSVAKVNRIETRSDGVFIYFVDTDGYPQRAIFEVPQSDKPKLKSMQFECPACFGDGINDGATCILCDGVGWGAGLRSGQNEGAQR
jgi:hypothetical protein